MGRLQLFIRNYIKGIGLRVFDHSCMNSLIIFHSYFLTSKYLKVYDKHLMPTLNQIDVDRIWIQLAFIGLLIGQDMDIDEAYRGSGMDIIRIQPKPDLLPQLITHPIHLKLFSPSQVYTQTLKEHGQVKELIILLEQIWSKVSRIRTILTKNCLSSRSLRLA